MYQVKCKIEGVVPIMFCRFPEPEKPGDTKKQKKQTLEEKMWIDEKGVYIPIDNLRMLLVGNRFRPGAAKIYGSEYESKKGTKYVGNVYSPLEEIEFYYEISSDGLHDFS